MSRVGSAGDGPDLDPVVKTGKTASRPGSQWATGKRRQGKSATEKKGFARGARVK
jgi:hypothetical protein